MSFIDVFGKRHEEERLEASMLDSFASDLGSNSERVRRKLMKRAGTRPQETVVLLLRTYENDDERVRRSVLEILTELAKDRSMLTVIMDEMVHPARDVRKAVKSFLGELVGPHAAIYASHYEQTMLLAAMAKRKDVPIEDIVSLAELSRETFMDGEVMESIRDIGYCLDQAQHRYRSSEQLKDYLSDILKMAPDLSRMGVYSGSIEEPLRKAMKAARGRSFDETRDVIEERKREAELRNDLRSMAMEVRENFTSRPMTDANVLMDEDRDELVTLRGMAESVETLLSSGRRVKAVVMLHDYIGGFMSAYQAKLKPRINAGDKAASILTYVTCLACVKVASRLIPVTAEKAYLEGFKDLEKAASIEIVVLPGDIVRR
jgi:histone H3/H4